MNSLPLSLCHSRKGKGKRVRMRWTADRTRSWCNPHSGWSSIQLVATSTVTREAR